MKYVCSRAHNGANQWMEWRVVVLSGLGSVAFSVPVTVSDFLATTPGFSRLSFFVPGIHTS